MAENAQELVERIIGAGKEGASTEVAPPVAEETESRQPDTEQTAGDGAPQQAAKQKVDLTQFEEFRAYQQSQDRKLAQLQQQLAAEQARVQAEQERIRAEKMANMDDFERTQFERDEYAQKSQYLEQQLAFIEAERYRDRRIAEIQQQVVSETGVNVPREQIDMTSPDNAVTSAYRYAVQRLRQGQSQAVVEEAQQLAQRNIANQVDLGGGAPNTADTRFRARLNDQRKGKTTAPDTYREILRFARDG